MGFDRTAEAQRAADDERSRREQAATELTPGPGREDWIDFLHYMAGERGAEGGAIVAIVEKPHNYGQEYREYLDAGGTDR